MELIDYVNEHAKFLTKKLAENWTVENRKELFKVLSDLEKFEANQISGICPASNQSKDLGIRSISRIDWKELAKSVKSEKLSQIGYGIKKVLEYNPKAWNEYPKVTPPFDIDMRVELNDGLRYCARYHKFSDGCFWVGTNGTCFPKYLNDKVVRFRPWED